MQQFVILPKSDNEYLGEKAEVIKSLRYLNTAPSSDATINVLWGPGIRIDLPNEQDPVPQMLVTFTEEEIAWNVLIKIAKECNWMVQDTNSGRTLSF